MHRFWLTFSNQELEEQYVRHMAREAIRNVDGLYLVTVFLMQVTGLIKHRDNISADDFPGALCMYLGWMALEMVVRRNVSTDSLIKLRTTLVVISRWGVNRRRSRGFVGLERERSYQGGLWLPKSWMQGASTREGRLPCHCASPTRKRVVEKRALGALSLSPKEPCNAKIACCVQTGGRGSALLVACRSYSSHLRCALPVLWDASARSISWSRIDAATRIRAKLRVRRVPCSP